MDTGALATLTTARTLSPERDFLFLQVAVANYRSGRDDVALKEPRLRRSSVDKAFVIVRRHVRRPAVT